MAESVFSVDVTRWVSEDGLTSGVDYWTGRLVAKDDQGQALVDLDPTKVIFTPSSPNVSVTEVVNEGEGVYSAQFRLRGSAPPPEGGYTVSVSYDGSDKVPDASGQANLPIPFDISSWDDDPTPRMVVSADRTSAFVGETVILTARPVNPAEAAARVLLEFWVTGGEVNGRPMVVVPTDESGTASVILTSAAVGVAQIDVVTVSPIQGLPAVGSPLKVEFKARVPVAARSSLAAEADTVVARVVDAADVGLPGVEVSFVADVAGALRPQADPGGESTSLMVVTDADGIARVWVDPLPAVHDCVTPASTMVSASITVAGVQEALGASPVAVTALPPAGSQCPDLSVAMTDGQPSVLADGVASWTARVEIRAPGTPPGGPVTGIADALKVVSNPVGLVSSVFVEVSDGVYETRLTSLMPGEYTIRAQHDTLLSNEQTVVFSSVPARVPDAEQSSLVIARTLATVGDEVLANVTARDAAGNPVPAVTVTMTTNGSTGASETSCVTGDGTGGSTLGVCVITLSSHVAETTTVTASMLVDGFWVPLVDAPILVTWGAGCVPGADSGCVYDPSVDNEHRTQVRVTVDDQQVGGIGQATVSVFDLYGNPVDRPVTSEPDVGMTVSSIKHIDTGLTVIAHTSASAGTYQAKILVAGQEVAFIPQSGSTLGAQPGSSPVSLTFTAPPGSPNTPPIAAPTGGSASPTPPGGAMSAILCTIGGIGILLLATRRISVTK